MYDALLLAALVLGLAAGGVLIARSPTFWLGLALVVFDRLQPYLIILLRYLLQPLPPDDQKKLDETRRSGQEWDFRTKGPRKR